jgi:hypothetical protein
VCFLTFNEDLQPRRRHPNPAPFFYLPPCSAAASPRLLCSSSVMSGASPRHDQGFRAVTIADRFGALAETSAAVLGCPSPALLVCKGRAPLT